MAILVLARRDQHLVPLKGRGGNGACLFEHRAQAIARGLKLGAVLPIATRPRTEAEAWPSAQALTSCANSVIRPSFTTTSTVTVDPHRGERFFALPIGVESLP